MVREENLGGREGREEDKRTNSEEGLSVSGPGEGGALDLLTVSDLGVKVVDDGPERRRRSEEEDGSKNEGRGRRQTTRAKKERENETHLDSKSKILIPEAVAAQSQYRLGEKTRALTMSPASRE